MKIKDKIFRILFIIFCLYIVSVNWAFSEATNSSTSVPRVVLAELFVQADCPTCPQVEFCLEDLVWEYGLEKVILVKEHLWGDGYDTLETNARYNWYVGEGKKSTPDVFINGLTHRIQGLACEDVDENYDYYKNLIDSELARTSPLEISASKNIFNSTIIIEGKIKNINKLPLKNIAVCGMIYKQGEETGLYYWVRDILPLQNIPLFSFGESFSFKFVSEPLIQDEDDEELYHAVIFVQNLETKEVLQALHVE